MAIRKDNFIVRAQLAGMLYWTCPKCGHMNKTQVKPGTWKAQCGASTCYRWIMFGLQWHPIEPGTSKHAIPPDAVMSYKQEPLPACKDGDTWFAGEPIHSQMDIDELSHPKANE
jgi:hypothetical protein